jgi:hypothetical protein
MADGVMQHIVHHGLEGRRSVSQAEQHDQELKVVMVGTECHLHDVVIVHTDLVVATAQVQLGEEKRAP